jgi:hypothetical protein
MFDVFIIAYASGFFLGAAFFTAFTGAVSAAAFADLLVADLFSLARMAERLRETPKEPFDLFPFFDFLSPLPIAVV